jgi:hypothetical protein
VLLRLICTQTSVPPRNVPVSTTIYVSIAKPTVIMKGFWRSFTKKGLKGSSPTGLMSLVGLFAKEMILLVSMFSMAQTLSEGVRGALVLLLLALPEKLSHPVPTTLPHLWIPLENILPAKEKKERSLCHFFMTRHLRRLLLDPDRCQILPDLALSRMALSCRIL